MKTKAELQQNILNIAMKIQMEFPELSDHIKEIAGINNPKHQNYINNNPTEYKEYKTKVTYYTEQSYKKHIKILDRYKLRSKEYHLDHIIPISYGWINKIEPKIIGSLNNIQILIKIENLKKSNKINDLPLWYIILLIKNQNTSYETNIDRHTLFWENITNKIPEWITSI